MSITKKQSRAGGKKRMGKLTKQERSEFARHAAQIRWQKERAKKKGGKKK